MEWPLAVPRMTLAGAPRLLPEPLRLGTAFAEIRPGPLGRMTARREVREVHFSHKAGPIWSY